MSKKEATFAGSKADFIQLVRLWEGLQVPDETPGARLLTRPEIAEHLMTIIEFDFGEYPDYETMELCETGESDLLEKMLETLNKMEEEMKMEGIGKTTQIDPLIPA